MSKIYKPAIFQATIRPSWGGILSYISKEEKSDILDAIIKYPENTGIKSKFWEETIKPDLDLQYEQFNKTCESRGRGARTYWGEHKLSSCSTYDKHKDNSLKDKDKDKDKYKDNIFIENFNSFWELYTPIKSSDGKFVSKGNKSSCQQKYIKLLQNGVKHETIISGLKQYLTYCRENGFCSCGAEVFLNQRRFENDYTGNGTVQSRVATGPSGKGSSIIDIAREFIEETNNRNENGIY